MVITFETPPASSETEDQRIERLKRELAREEQRLAEIDKTVEEKMEARYATGELERAKAPTGNDQPGFDTPGHRTALRNMRSADMIQAWYQYTPEIFDLELLTETIMQGVWSEVRKSPQFDSLFKDRMRVKKRQYVRYAGDFTIGFHPNITKRLAEFNEHALNELRKLANKQLMKLGPDSKDSKKGKSYFDLFNTDFESGGRTRNIGEEYQKLIEEYNKANPERPIADTATPWERATDYYDAGQTSWNIVSPNLADNEFALMPSSLRGLYVTMRNMDENKLQHYRDKDLDVKIPMVEFFIRQFRDEVLGVREATKSNLELMTWFVNKAGQNFIPWRDIDKDLTDWWEIIKALLGRPKDSRVQPSIYPYLQDQNSGGNQSKVIQKINEYRRKEGEKTGKELPEWTMDDTPFSRIGVTIGFAKDTKK